MASGFKSVRECLDSYVIETKTEGVPPEELERIAFLCGVISAVGLTREGVAHVQEQAAAMLKEMMR